MPHYSEYLKHKAEFDTVSKNNSEVSYFHRKTDLIAHPEILYAYRQILDAHEKYINYDLNSCYTADFPNEEKREIIKLFISNGEVMFSQADDVTKLIYKEWNNPVFTDLKNQLIEQLKSFYEMSTRTHFPERDDLKDPRFIFYHICGLYPLLDDEGLEMLKSVCTLLYNDAQDMMMFAMYQLDPFKHFDTIKWILNYWDKNQNILIEDGTGIYGELCEILYHYEEIGFDYKSDTEFHEILKSNYVYDHYVPKQFRKKILSGKEFNELTNGKIFVVTIDEDDEKITTGLNDDKGKYYRFVEESQMYINFTRNTIGFRYVTVPDDTKVTCVGSIFRSDAIVVSELINLKDYEKFYSEEFKTSFFEYSDWMANKFYTVQII